MLKKWLVISLVLALSVIVGGCCSTKKSVKFEEDKGYVPNKVNHLKITGDLKCNKQEDWIGVDHINLLYSFTRVNNSMDILTHSSLVRKEFEAGTMKPNIFSVTHNIEDNDYIEIRLLLIEEDKGPSITTFFNLMRETLKDATLLGQLLSIIPGTAVAFGELFGGIDGHDNLGEKLFFVRPNDLPYSDTLRFNDDDADYELTLKISFVN